MSDPTSMTRDEFFVGWLRPPAGYVRFLRPVAFLLLLAAGVIAVLVAVGQRSPGTGSWDGDRRVTFRGIVYAEPYALIRVLDEKENKVRTILLVEESKFGAAERVRPFVGQSVQVAGTLLHRDDRWMLELAAGDEGLRPVAPLLLPEPKRGEPHPVELRGEIIDSKCYLGAMKPGGGKTHKACAALCVSGGVPPMFVSRDAGGKETFYLLTAPDGGPMRDEVLPFVGDPVEVRGVVEGRDDLRLLRAGAADIRRR